MKYFTIFGTFRGSAVVIVKNGNVKIKIFDDFDPGLRVKIETDTTLVRQTGDRVESGCEIHLRSVELEGLKSQGNQCLTTRFNRFVNVVLSVDHSAAKELDEAAKLDPEHEMVKNLRRQLGG